VIIAKGEYEWPSLPPLPPGQTDNTNTQSAEELLCRTQLVYIPRVWKVMERLLVRDPKKWATLLEGPLG